MDTHTIFFNCFECLENFIKNLGRGFPGGSVVKNPPANAGDMRWIPGSREIPHATEQLSPCTTTIEPVLQSPGIAATEALEPVLCDKRRYRNKKPASPLERSLHSPRLEKHLLSNKDPAQPKVNKQNTFFNSGRKIFQVKLCLTQNPMASYYIQSQVKVLTMVYYALSNLGLSPNHNSQP